MSYEEREAMELIEEYLSEVREHLPEDIADDIVEELRTHIIDESTELGGLTVRNVYKVIRKLGDPRELASKYVVGRRRKVLSFEFGISEDLYPYFVQISYIISIILIIAYFLRIIYVATRYSSATSLIYIPILFAQLIISIAVTVLLLYIVMSFFSSNPDLKVITQKILREIFGEPKKAKRKHKIEHKKEAVRKTQIVTKPKPEIGIKEEKPIPIKLSRISTLTKISTLFSGIISIILSYLLYISIYYINYNWLSLNLVYTLVIAFSASAVIEIGHFFYMSYTDKKNYLVQVLMALLGFVFIPWLIQANIYTEDLQVPYINPELFVRNDWSNFITYISMNSIPSDLVLLANILSLLFIVIIVVNAVISILKYSRTSPKKKAEEILLGLEK